jgi:astacin
MDHWKTRTKGRITFATCDAKSAKDFVRFTRGSGCFSNWVGKKGGEQQVGLDVGCELPQVIHEIGHVVGLFHEQNRLDRERYIEVREEHMEASVADQFNRSLLLAEDKARDQGPFDWKSIMLYPPKAFSKDKQQTLVRIDSVEKRGDTAWGLACGDLYGGVTTELSEGDVAAVRNLYDNAGK